MSETTGDEDRFLLSINLDQLGENNTEADGDYRRLLDILVRHHWLNVRTMSAELASKMHLSGNTIQEEYKSFIGDRKRMVLDYIDRHQHLKPHQEWAAQNVPGGPLFSKLGDFLGIVDRERREAPELLVGTYQTWRYSISTPGMYIKGALQIWESQNLVLLAKAHQRNEPKDDISTNHLRPRFEYLSGYIYRQLGGRCFLFLSDQSHQQMRFCILPNIAPETKKFDDTQPGEPFMSRKVFSLSGGVLGTDEGKSFTSPVYIERVWDDVAPLSGTKNEALLDSLNVYPEKLVPPKVVAILRTPLVLL